MAVIIIQRAVNLDAALYTEPLHGTLYGGEQDSHEFIISATRGGADYAFDGTATARYIRADGETLMLSGMVAGGKCIVELPQACYAVPGRFTLTIFNTTDAGAKGAVYTCTGNVAQTTTGEELDPGSAVPDIDDIQAEYQRMQAATDAANAAADAATEAAEAVGDDVAGLKSTLAKYNNVNLIDGVGQRGSETKAGITYAWNADGTCTVSGTATGISLNNMIYPAIPLPEGMSAGDEIEIIYRTTNPDVMLTMRFCDDASGSGSTNLYFRTDQKIIVPSKTHLWVGLYVHSGIVLPEAVQVTQIIIANHKAYVFPGEAEAGAMYAARFDGNVATGLLNQLNAVDGWRKNAYIDLDSGRVIYTVSASSCSEKLISIPRGMDIHIHGANRVAKYGADGAFIGGFNPATLDTVVSYDDAAFIRLQYGSTDDSVLNFYCAYWYTVHDEAAGLAYKLGEAEEAVNQTGVTAAPKTGNPLVLTDCDSRRAFEAFSASDVASGEKIVICKKNMFALRHVNGTFTKNNVKFSFNTILHTIRIRTESGQSASAATTSGFSDFGDDFKTVNGSTFYHNFKFRFPADTQVSVSDNPSIQIPFDFGVQMRIYDGTNTYRVGAGGLTFVAQANTEYIAYFVVRSGWSGDVTYAPQIEIGAHPTAYETFVGVKTDLLTTGDENIFTCGGKAPGRYTTLNGKIVTLFDSATNEIYLDAHNDTDSVRLIYDTSKDGTINGVTAYYIFKFTPGAVPVYVRAYDDTFAGKIDAQITDGTNIKHDYIGNGIYFMGEAGKEYGFRITIRANSEFNGIIRPAISTGLYAIRAFGTYAKTTVMYTDGNASMTVTPRLISTRQKADKNLKTCNALETLTGGRIYTPFAQMIKRGPMVSFIDDDTTNLTYVQRYHACFEGTGAVGGFAVMTSHLDEDPNLVSTLLEYETEGYSCQYHCHTQKTATDSGRYWIYGDPEYDPVKIRENFMTGLRKMREYGFSNYRQWVTPFGVNDKYIVDLAKNHGMECIMTCPSTYAQEGFVTPYGNVSRWNIPRIIFYQNAEGTTSNDDMLHRVIDNAILSKGWVVIVSHVNSWGAGDTMDTRFRALINYCIDSGAEIVPETVAFENYRAAFMAQELF